MARSSSDVHLFTVSLTQPIAHLAIFRPWINKAVPLTYSLLTYLHSQRASKRSNRTNARVLPGLSFPLVSRSRSTKRFTYRLQPQR